MKNTHFYYFQKHISIVVFHDLIILSENQLPILNYELLKLFISHVFVKGIITKFGIFFIIGPILLKFSHNR